MSLIYMGVLSDDDMVTGHVMVKEQTTEFG